MIGHNNNDDFRSRIILRITRKGCKSNVYHYSFNLIFVNIYFDFFKKIYSIKLDKETNSSGEHNSLYFK
jgi:hypothetical protein